MPDDLKWSWCNNNNRNNVHNKCNMLESSWNRPPAPYTPPPTPHNPFHGNIVLHQTGPWCLKVRDHWRWFCQAANSPHTDALGDGQLCPGCDVQPLTLVFLTLASSGSPTLPTTQSRASLDAQSRLVKSFPSVSGQDSLAVYSQKFYPFYLSVKSSKHP